jgi:hypothetical protein
MSNRKGQGSRKEKRVPFKEFVLVNGALRARAIGISEGGIYVHTGRHEGGKDGYDVPLVQLNGISFDVMISNSYLDSKS